MRLAIFIYVMGKKTVVLLPKVQAVLTTLGENIKLARLRRNISADLLAQRAGISRAALHNVEKGSPSVAMGIYVSVLHALRLEEDLLLVAKDDILGRKLQDIGLTTGKRASK